MAFWNRDFQASLRGLIESVIRPEKKERERDFSLLLFKEISLICPREISISMICHYYRVMELYASKRMIIKTKNKL